MMCDISWVFSTQNVIITMPLFEGLEKCCFGEKDASVLLCTLGDKSSAFSF